MEVEFVERDPEAARAGPDPRPERSGAVPGLFATVGFTAAAVLATIAPFRRLYSLRITSGGVSQSVNNDGWGRTVVSEAAGATPQHGPRYGVILVALAAVCAVLAVTSAIVFLRGGRRTACAALGIAGMIVSAALATAAAMMWLDTSSVLDNFRELSQRRIGETVAEHVIVRAAQGSVVWVTLAAMIWGLAGAVVCTTRARAQPVRTRPAAPKEPAVPQEPPSVEPDAGEELTL